MVPWNPALRAVYSNEKFHQVFKWFLQEDRKQLKSILRSRIKKVFRVARVQETDVEDTNVQDIVAEYEMFTAKWNLFSLFLLDLVPDFVPEILLKSVHLIFDRQVHVFISECSRHAGVIQDEGLLQQPAQEHSEIFPT